MTCDELRVASNRVEDHKLNVTGVRPIPALATVSLASLAWLAQLALAGGFAGDASETRSFTGRVVDERRFPVAGAKIAVLGRTPTSPAPMAVTVELVSGADGSFTVEVPFTPGEGDASERNESGESNRLWTLLVTTPDRRVGHGFAWFNAPELKRRRVLPLREPIVVVPCGKLVVDVQDADGAVAGATVEVRYPWLEAAVATAVSDAQGHARVDPAPVGEFALFVKKSGRGRATVETRIRSDATTQARVELHKLRTLVVEVVEVGSGAPIPGAALAVTRLATGPNPGAFPNLNHREDDAAEPRRTDARGRLELRDLEAESMLQLVASAPRYVEWSGELRHRGEDFVPYEPSPWQGVSADAGSIRIEMARLKPSTLRWRIVPGSAPTPPDGTALALRYFDPFLLRGQVGSALSHGVVRGGAVEVENEIAPGTDPRWNGLSGWAEAPDGSIAELAPARGGDGDGTARFAPGGPLMVQLLAPDGTPQPDQSVSVSLEMSDEESGRSPNDWSMTDAKGVARFPSLRAGRWIVAAEGVARVVEFKGAPTSVALTQRPSAEIVVEFTVDGARRLPAEWQLWVDGERLALRREDPERGDLHLFVTRPAPGKSLRLEITCEAWGTISRTLSFPSPAPKEGGALVVPVALGPQARCEVVARVRVARTSKPPAPPPIQAMVVLERQDEATGAFDSLGNRYTFRLPSEREPQEQIYSDVPAGTWRLAIPETRTCGEAVRVAAGASPAELELDASSVTRVEVAWQIPDGENGDFLELERPGARPLDRWWRDWESQWPLTPSQQNSLPLAFDRKSPPPLRVRHPYLVASKWNDSIDLTKPRSTITLHMELGPLVTFTPEFAGDVPVLHGAFVTLADARDATKPPELRRALKRGERFAMAPPAAGEWRMLIDPVVAAPAELDAVAFDGGPRDLGSIRFAAGSTLHVHARASAPFVAPRVYARATRIDGLAYDRASSVPQSIKAPIDPEIRALGPGLFRVTLEGDSGWQEWTWSAEVRVDGVHDAEVEVVTD